LITKSPIPTRGSTPSVAGDLPEPLTIEPTPPTTTEATTAETPTAPKNPQHLTIELEDQMIAVHIQVRLTPNDVDIIENLLPLGTGLPLITMVVPPLIEKGALVIIIVKDPRGTTPPTGDHYIQDMHI